MNARLLVLLAALSSIHAALPAQAPRADAAAAPARSKPARYQIPPGWEQHMVTVKFRDGLAIRLRDGAPVDLGGTGALAKAAAVLERMRGGTWSRAHSLPEAELDRMRAIGERNLGAPLSDLNLQFCCMLPAEVDTVAVIDALNALDCVEMAESIPGYVPLPNRPAPDALPPQGPLPQDWRSRQGYSEPAPRGIGAGTFQGFADNNLFSNFAGVGSHVRIADIENGFVPHADLPPVSLVTAPGYTTAADNEHGTAVLGQLFARNDGLGTTGMAHGSQAFFAHARTLPQPGFPFGVYDVPNAISTAASAVGAGGVILIEQQISGPRWNQQPTSQFGLLPVEGHGPTWTAIYNAVAMGVVVVEAAGNGSQNLDDPIYTGWFSAAHDSGAIMVGAGAAPGGSGAARSRLSFSNYGETVDLQGWGEAIVTTGYGDLYSAAGPAMQYTQQFGGTSGASPIVTGACALLQSLHFERFGSFLQPAALRSALRRSGTPQAGAPFAIDNIGPLPDVVKTALDLRLYRGFELTHGFSMPLPGSGGNGLDGGPFAGPSVGAMVEFDDDGPGPHEPCLYVGGQFASAGGVPASNIARWNGVGWSALGTGITISGQPGYNGTVLALAVHDPDGPGSLPAELYVGGGFSHAGGVPTSGLAKWNGLSWSPVGSGFVFGVVHALTAFDEDGPGSQPASLIVGGDLNVLGASTQVARWRSNTWSLMNAGFDQRVDALEVFDPDDTGPLPARLIAGGLFRSSGGAPLRSLAIFDGTNWSELGGGATNLGDWVWALEAVNVGPGQQLLFVGGQFLELGGVPVPAWSPGFGVWNGFGWQFPSSAVPQPQGIRAFDDGTHTTLPCRPDVYLTNYTGQLYRMDTSTWTTTTLPVNTAGGGCLHVFDEDGVGGMPPALLLGGFAVNGNANSSGIARWLGVPPVSLTGSISTLVTGCGGQFQPTIATTGQAVLGQPFTVQFDCLPQSLPVLVMGPPEPTPLPLCSAQSSCMLAVQPLMLMLGTSATFAVPCDPGLIGGTVALQGAEVAALPYGSFCAPPYVPFSLRVTDTLLVTL